MSVLATRKTRFSKGNRQIKEEVQGRLRAYNCRSMSKKTYRVQNKELPVLSGSCRSGQGRLSVVVTTELELEEQLGRQVEGEW